jgi:hypothetical protein
MNVKRLIADLEEAIEKDAVGGKLAQLSYDELHQWVDDFAKLKELHKAAQKILVRYQKAKSKK